MIHKPTQNNIIFMKIVDLVVPLGIGDSIFDGDILLNGFRCSFNYFYKFKVIKEYMIDNIFLDENKKQQFMQYFTKLQNTWFALKKFSHIIKFNKLKHKITYFCDLFFNDISSCKNSQKIVLIEHGVPYLFKITDLVHMIVSNLSQNDAMFETPSHTKNPFTGLPLSLHNLYNIFFHCVYEKFHIPKYLKYYFDCDFNLSNLLFYYQPQLRELSIQNFSQDMSFDDKYSYIMEMLEKKHNIIPLSIHHEFPKQIIVNKFETVISIYLKSEYSLLTNIKKSNRLKLNRFLSNFYTKNMTLGRMYYNFRDSNYTEPSSSFTFTPPSNPNANNADISMNNLNQLTINSTSTIPTTYNSNISSIFVFGRQHNTLPHNANNTDIDNFDNIFVVSSSQNDDHNNNNRPRSTTLDQITLNQLRIREMLAGDDYDDYDHNDHNGDHHMQFVYYGTDPAVDEGPMDDTD